MLRLSVCKTQKTWIACVLARLERRLNQRVSFMVHAPQDFPKHLENCVQVCEYYRSPMVAGKAFTVKVDFTFNLVDLNIVGIIGR